MKKTFAAVLAAGLAWGMGALAQAYPERPIRVISPYAPGGQSDVVIRIVTDKMSQALGQQFIIEPRPGAGGNLAMEHVAKSAPDGYTLLLGPPLVAINASLYRGLSFDPLKDLVPISLMAYGPYVLFVSGTLPVKNAGELVALAKKEPGKLNFFSQGVGTGTHLVAVMFAQAAGIELTHVPYRGFGQALPDLVTGQVHIAFNGVDAAKQLEAEGKVKNLGFASEKRVPRYPDIPAVAEYVPGFEAAGWYGFFAPKGTPTAILERLNAEVVKAVNLPEIGDRIQQMGLLPRPQTLQEASAFVQREADRWGKAVAASGAKMGD